jgi:hypothetical protein
MNDTLGKYARLQNGEQPSPFIDPAGWDKFLARLEARFQETVAELKRNQSPN